MRLDAKIVGTTAGPRTGEVEARWLMAYAAALGEAAPEYVDTTTGAGPGGIVAHPLFPVCYEWPLVLAVREATVPAEAAPLAVHATHDLRLHRRPRPGDRLRTTATVIGVSPRPAGAYVLTRLVTLDAEDRAVSTTTHGALYRGLGADAAGAPAVPEDGLPPRAPERGAPAWSEAIPIPAWLGHVYSECARIWNPIHTDRAVALAAGLPGVILHGTATLALAVSRLVAREPGGPCAQVRRIACRFGAMVPIPSTVTLRAAPPVDRVEGRWLAFEVVTAARAPAVRDGWVLIKR